MSDTIVVVPCYNEARRFAGEAFDRFLAAAPDAGLVIVDDGSTDGTLPLLEAFGARHPGRVAVLALPRNGGKAEAVRQGVLRALDDKPSCVGYWDADLATPLDAIPRFREILRERSEIDIVQGARVKLLGRQIERRASRHYAGRAAATAISAVLGIPVYDTQCGAKLFRTSDEMRTLFRDPFLSGWLFDVEIIARLMRLRSGAGRHAVCDAIYEYPLLVWTEVPGSKIRPSDYLWAARDLYRIYRRYLARGAVDPSG